MKEKVMAIVLAAGRGRRMESDVQKQYMEVNGKPLLYYALDAFERSIVDGVVLVTGHDEQEYCRREIVERYGFSKVEQIVEGGKERYHSVYEGLKAIGDCDYVLIHDGARPCIDERIIGDAIHGAKEYSACVVGMPVKDTIKVADVHGYADQTPDRSKLWMIQTPQAFSFDVIYQAYTQLFLSEENQCNITDDAMVVERMTGIKVKLIQGSYENIKVTTPEDILLAETLLKRR